MVTPDISDLKKLEEFLYELRNCGSKYSLDRMFAFAAALGNPQKKYPCIHIAGSNGKGSVSAMLENGLRAHGIKCGLYTSPHLVYLGERIRMGDSAIKKEELLRLVGRVAKSAEEVFRGKSDAEWPSFFEYMTVAAFKYFADKQAEFAVVEVGLGGRLDATNILEAPALCVITSISLDHTELLGDTIEKIAFEKAGIIKRNSDVVCGYLPPAARRVIEERASALNAKTYFAEDFCPDYKKAPVCALPCDYQLKNAAIASLCASVLRKSGRMPFLDEDLFRESLKSVVWPARWQKIEVSQSRSYVILDSSHNPEGAEELEKNLRRLKAENPFKKICVAVGSLGEERARHILKAACAYADKLYLLEVNNPRALKHEALVNCLPNAFTSYVKSSVAKLIPRKGFCAAINENTILVCTGSIYLAGEFLAAINGDSGDDLQDRV